MAISIGIGIPNTLTAAGPSLGTTIATTHYNRVIADGGVVPAGISGLSSILNSVISAYSITGSSDFNTKVPVFLDPHYTGYKLGAGSGTTLGQAARTVYAINSSADVTQATAASQPLLLAHSGTNYWWGSGVVSNYVSTPSSVANSIVGDIEIIAKVNMPNLTTQFNIIGKYGNTAPSQNYILYINSSNKIGFAYNNGQTQISSVIQPYAANTDFWVKCTRASISGDIYFYTSSNGTTWTQLGTLVSSVAGAITTSTQQVEVGSLLSGGIVTTGKIYRATISNTIGGSPVVDFNPASYSASTSQTAWTSSTGETWTINQDSGTGTGYRGILVDKTILMSDGVDDSMVNTFSLATVKSIYNAYTIWNTLATGSLFASNNAAEVIDANMNSTAFVYQLDNAAASISIATTGTARLRTLRTAVINGAGSLQKLNNGTAVTGTLGTSLSTSMKIMQERNGSYKSKMIYSSLLVSGQADTTLQQTAIYNVLKSMNNNAF